jgi:hypothetical protein
MLTLAARPSWQLRHKIMVVAPDPSVLEARGPVGSVTEYVVLVILEV